MLPVIVIAGPTASGKSSLALEIARELGGEIVNADAFQVYRGLEILTAQPPEEDRALVPHHLYGHIPVTEEVTAASHARDAERSIAKIRAAGKMPILCGGTGLYIKAVTHGLDPVPPSDPLLRSRLEARELADLADELCRLDPEAKHFVDLQNPRRVVRALEITLQTGVPVSQFRKSWQESPQGGFIGFSITVDRETLQRRIAERTHSMIASGVVEEVQRAQAVGLAARRAIGFREIEEMLRGNIDRRECEESINSLTRQYAKRQGTWFRKEKWLRAVSLGENSTARLIADLRLKI